MECIYTYTIPPILPTETGFPSLTEFSDLPSIYSQPHFPQSTPHPDSSPPQFDFATPPQYAAGPAFKRNNNEVSRQFRRHNRYAAARPGPNLDVRLLGGSVSLESMQAEDEELDSRLLSFLGPTIQFHSLAPWVDRR